MKIQQKLTQTQVQTQQIVMTPKLQQAIKVLVMPQLELRQFIDQELEQNPLLEVVDEDETALSMEDYDPALEWNNREENISEEDTSIDIDWNSVFNDIREPVGHSNHNYEDPDAPEPDVAEIQSLQKYLLDQLNLAHFDDVERGIGELIIGNLNDDGQLKLKLFSVPSEYIVDFENGCLSEELQTLLTKKFSVLSTSGNKTNRGENSFEVKPVMPELYKQTCWQLVETLGKRTYTVKYEGNELNIYELTLEDIAFQAGCSVSAVEKVLRTIQNTFEPTGIAYRDLKETLSLQIEHYQMQHYRHNGVARYDNEVLIQLARTIIEHHLSDLLKNRFVAISESLEVDKEDIIRAANWIGTLSPYPGRYFSDPSIKDLAKSPGAVQGITPDVQIVKINEEYNILPIDNYIPRLHINPYYINLMRDKHLDVETEKWIRKKHSDASDLLSSIVQRGSTIERVTKAIFDIQSEFLEHGPQSIKPLTLKTIADMTGVHESTVSRATSNKYVQTPIGTYPLKYFFSNQLATTRGNSVSAEKVKSEIKELISKENTMKPLSDQTISTALEKRGIVVARRTVQKYREELGILSSRQRKNQYLSSSI